MTFSIRDVIVLIYLKFIYSTSIYKHHFIKSISHHKYYISLVVYPIHGIIFCTQLVSTLDAMGFSDAFLIF